MNVYRFDEVGCDAISTLLDNLGAGISAKDHDLFQSCAIKLEETRPRHVLKNCSLKVMTTAMSESALGSIELVAGKGKSRFVAVWDDIQGARVIPTKKSWLSSARGNILSFDFLGWTNLLVSTLTFLTILWAAFRIASDLTLKVLLSGCLDLKNVVGDNPQCSYMENTLLMN